MNGKKGKPGADAPGARTKKRAGAPAAPSPENQPQNGGDGPHEPSGFIVVGMGASAGGLEALQSFFTKMPGNPGMCFVIVTHQSPNRTSLLPMLLAKRTTMRVIEVTEGTRLRPNHIYVSPPGVNLALVNGRLHTFEPSDDAPVHLPINFFFRSLAEDQRERAVAIVLSGTGSDGTAGLREVKAALGLTIVQTEQDAHFAGMPRSAINGDSPDIILPASEIPDRLIAYARSLQSGPASSSSEDAIADALSQIFLQLRQRTGHDFSAYKETTVRRRIERRVHVQRLGSVTDYAEHLRNHPAELDTLFDELLIGVTSFFRDTDAFETLSALLSRYVADKPDGYPLRVWVAGCSTGEEAYSIAMIVAESLEQHRKEMHVQIFATDLDPKAIETARQGLYPPSIVGDMTPKRLQRFFVQTAEGYQVRKELRELLVFATQNLIEDPPFTKLDLLSCRNLLIYLDGALQRRLFPIFHYVLRPGGMLLLGSSETVGAYGNLFEPVDKKWRMYVRKNVAGGAYLADVSPALPVTQSHAEGESSMPPTRPDLPTVQLADKLLLRELVPPTVIMRERGEIVHIHGRTGLFLEPAPGPQAAANIYNMAREGLHLELAASVRQATREKVEVVRRGVRVKSNGSHILMDLRVKRLEEPEGLRGLLRVSFENAGAERQPSEEEAAQAPQPSTRVAELERELQYSKESHQSTIEELETANEELKSTNEELQSTNEELQSANEELETSKEELQSLNEELQTVNVELQGKVEELSRANDDMTNLLNATDIATIFLDSSLKIKRHTEQARRVINLIPSDVGRSIADLVARLNYDRLVEDAQEVLRTLVYKEIEVQGAGDGKWYLMRMLPYRTVENVIDGLVITFVDITRVRVLQQIEQRIIHALEQSPVAVFSVDAGLRVIWASHSVFGHDARASLGKRLQEVVGDEQSEIIAVLQSAFQRGMSRRQFANGTLDGQRVRYDLSVAPQADQNGSTVAATCVVVRLRDGGEAS